MARLDELVTINATGVQVTSGAGSAVVAIPNAADGNRARFVHIQATGNAYIRPGTSGTTCTANDLLLSPNMFVRLNVQGFTHIAYIQETARRRSTSRRWRRDEAADRGSRAAGRSPRASGSSPSIRRSISGRPPSCKDTAAARR